MSASVIPLWGQAWELVITYQTANGLQTKTISTNSWEPESLRITFEVLQSTIQSPWWFADIVVYNLDPTDIAEIVYTAVKVTLKAGFQTGPTRSAVIWDGPIFQVLLDQENVVDTRLTLHCVSNPVVMENVTSFSVGKFASQAQVIAKMAANIGLPPIDQTNNTLNSTASQLLNAKQYPRGNTVFGKLGKQLDLVAGDQNLQTFRNGANAYMTSFGETDANGQAVRTPTPDYIFAPPNPPNTPTSSTLPAGTTQSIIGTPRQFPEGVIFTVLLDPRLQVQLPVLVVRLVGTLVTQQVRQIGGSFVTPLNDNLVFFAGQIRHVGDSRGNDWYTEVTGYNTTYGTALIDGIFAASSQPSLGG
jgi:hypothetical protein